MIKNQNEVSRNLEKALQALEQAKQRVANEKKKQNEKKRKAENHHKYIMGGIIVKYFPDCYQYDEDELKRFIRFRSLGEDFTEENLKKVIAGEKESPEKNEKVPERKEAKPEKRKFDLVVDIQEKMAQGKNGGYVRWAKKYNVKQFAESILFLQQHDIHDKETLDALVDGSAARYHELMKIIKDVETKMAENKVLKTHIINYSKTRDTYVAYRKAGYSKKFLEAHREDILIHKAAKQAFEGLEHIPRGKELNAEYAQIQAQRSELRSELQAARKKSREYKLAKENIRMFFEQDTRREEERRREQQR